MNKIETTAYQIAERFLGLKEVKGAVDNPQVMAMLKLDNDWPQNDETPWCSAFVNYIAWLLRLPRSKDLRARSWINTGIPVGIDKAEVGFDIVVLTRAGDNSGPDVIKAPGHVGFFAGRNKDSVLILGGNQGDQVSVLGFDPGRVLAVRRLAG
jgi:uncharacterized protein (TIGR02594 family)